MRAILAPPQTLAFTFRTIPVAYLTQTAAIAISQEIVGTPVAASIRYTAS